jgi:hypothetical protein
MSFECLNGVVYKFSGKIEHWVTTYHRGFWGLPEDREAKWREIENGDTFLFHATKSKYVNAGDAGGGVIGLGIVGGFDTKEEPVWLEERQGGRTYPYLIYFREMYWFGDDTNVRDAPIHEKGSHEIIDDCHRLSENILSFKEMREQTDYALSSMGVMAEVKQIEKLRPLLYGRLRGASPDVRDVPSDSHESSDVERTLTANRRRQRTGASQTTLDSSTFDYEVTVDIEDTQRKSRQHEHILDAVERRLNEAGYETSETQQSDLVASCGDDRILAEAKTVNEQNERKQIREAIGQLHEYRYFDFRVDDSISRDPELLLILSQPPSDRYGLFLDDLQPDVRTLWVGEGVVDGFDDSLTWLASLD